MKQITSILILSYFLSGIFLLPQGDFSVMPDLPKMYQHCKLTEDADMNLMDFVTDHLLDIDGSFDKHDCGDAQKPHSSAPFQHQQHQSIYNVVSVFVNTFISFNQIIIVPAISTVFYHSDFASGIFHPPSL